MKRLTRAGFALSLLGVGMLFLGCNKAPEATATTTSATPAQQGGANSPKAQSGGGVPDEKDYPAPSGVRTGVQAGGAK